MFAYGSSNCHKFTGMCQIYWFLLSWFYFSLKTHFVKLSHLESVLKEFCPFIPRPRWLSSTAPAHKIYTTAPRRHLRGTSPGKDNLAPAEDVHNKNPSLPLSGKITLKRNQNWVQKGPWAHGPGPILKIFEFLQFVCFVSPICFFEFLDLRWPLLPQDPP